MVFFANYTCGFQGPNAFSVVLDVSTAEQADG
jgi:hypothetical protein